MVNLIRYRQSKIKRQGCEKVANHAFKKFGSLTSLHGLINIIDDFEYLNQLFTEANMSKRWLSLQFWFFFSSYHCILKMSPLKESHCRKSGCDYNLGRFICTWNCITISFELSDLAMTLCNINVVHRTSLQPIMNKLWVMKINFSQREKNWLSLYYLEELNEVSTKAIL